MVAALAAVLVAAAWELFVNTYRRVAKTQSAATALQKALVVLERFGRDVDEMGHPPVLDRRPTRIATDGAAISFYVPARPIDTTTVTVAYRPVVWRLKPLTGGLFAVQRDGESVGGIRVSTWTFLYIEEGAVRTAERDVGMDGFARGSLTESLPASFVSTQDPRTIKPREWARDVAAQLGSEADSEHSTATGPLAQALSEAGPLGHAGPFVYFRFTVVDEGGASASRAVLHDLVNVHMVADHGHGFPFPDNTMRLTGKLVTPPTLEVDNDATFDEN
jgi:hypothetical protein